MPRAQKSQKAQRGTPSASKDATSQLAQKRKVPMEVLSLGMPRTGTALYEAMQTALNTLGIPCYHGFTLIANTEDCAVWDQALDANYGAVVDLPAVAFAEELINTYPESKVVMVRRDIERWYQSFNEGVMENVWGPTSKIVARIDPGFFGRLGGTSGRWTRGWMESYSLREMQEKSRPKFREHYTLIKQLTPPERYLKFGLKDGWEPVCSFLGRSVPDVPFPHVNEAAALKEKINAIMLEGLKNAILSRNTLTFVSVPIAGLVWLLNS